MYKLNIYVFVIDAAGGCRVYVYKTHRHARDIKLFLVLGKAKTSM